MLPIIQAPHPVLSQPTKPVKRFDKALHTLIKEMSYTLEHTSDPEGVGLAAPQVAHSLQLFIIKEDPKAPLYVFINPEIKEQRHTPHPTLLPMGEGIAAISPSPEGEGRGEGNATVKGRRRTGRKENKGVKLEGCLSLKDIWGVVHRSPEVTLSYQDQTGKHYQKTFSGFLATIIQHECDHLQGILFPKRVLEQKEKLYKSIEEDGETVFEEIAI